MRTARESNFFGEGQRRADVIRGVIKLIKAGRDQDYGSGEIVAPRGNQAGWCIRGSCPRIWTFNGSWPNGMKLTLECLLYQLPTPFLSGCDHEREALGSPLPNARLRPMGAYGVHDQRH
jgi:hypothetical protein